MMESWKDPVPEGRRFVLSFELHPVIDHFAVSFAASAFVLSLFVLVFPQLYSQTATGMLRAFVGVLPFAVLAAFITGVIDGKARFRRVSTRALNRKKIIGAVHFIVTVGTAALLLSTGSFETWVREACAALLAVSVVCTALLSRQGAALAKAVIPGQGRD
jgi:uncharacterized membrane protein